MLRATLALCLAVAASACSSGSDDAPNAVLVVGVDTWKGLHFEVAVQGTEVLYRCGPSMDPEPRALRTRWAAFTVSSAEAHALFADLQQLGVEEWDDRYVADVLDGQGWELGMEIDGEIIQRGGSNAQPEQLSAVIDRIARFVKPYPFGFSGCISDEARERDCRSYAEPLSNHLTPPEGALIP